MPLTNEQPGRRSSHGGVNPYGPVFWCAYAANASLMIAVSILFRYADFVIGRLGGSERDLGLVVGVGMIGAIAMRVIQGVGIDRYGARAVWLLCLTLFIGATLSHQWIDGAHSPWLYAARIVWTTGVAGCFGASLTYISLRVPPERVAEMVGSLGTSGFVGLAIGPAMSDMMYREGEPLEFGVSRMFLSAAAMGGVSLLFTIAATARQPRRAPRRVPPLAAVVRRYHPGAVLLVAAAMGLGVSLPHVFLKAYVEELGIGRIRTFFWMYAATAFLVRVATRRTTERRGFRPVILAGLASLAASMLAYVPVRNEWQMAAPAMLAGIAHAFLFPAVVAAGSARFPARYRGVATTLTLAAFDMGSCVGQPLVGTIIVATRARDLPSYPTMFITVASATLLIAAIYAWRSGGERAESTIHKRRTRLNSGRAETVAATPETQHTDSVLDEAIRGPAVRAQDADEGVQVPDELVRMPDDASAPSQGDESLSGSTDSIPERSASCEPLRAS